MIRRLVDRVKLTGRTSLAIVLPCAAVGGVEASWLWILVAGLGLTFETWPRLHDRCMPCLRLDGQARNPGPIEETPSLLASLVQAIYLVNCAYAAAGWLLGHAVGRVLRDNARRRRTRASALEQR